MFVIQVLNLIGKYPGCIDDCFSAYFIFPARNAIGYLYTCNLTIQFQKTIDLEIV